MGRSASQHRAPNQEVLLLARTVHSKIFAEHLPGTVGRYARRSCRPSESLRWLHARSLGGKAGSRLARRLGLLASRTVLLRELRRHSKSASATPRVLGIDEWAWKKGHRYGTILCDLERGKVIDLLPTRDTATVAAWLSQHPTIEVVSRDRASSFADVVRRGQYKLPTAGICCTTSSRC